MSPDAAQAFTDVFVSESPEITVSYRSAGFVCEEGLRQGRWVTLSYNASGYLMAANNRPAPPYMKPDNFAEPQAFALNVDGQDLLSHWQWGGITISRDGGTVRACVTLRHAIRPVQVLIRTVLDGTPVMTRTLEVENTGTRPAALAGLAPLAGGVQQISYARQRVATGDRPYRLGIMLQSTWGNEGDFRWVDLPPAGYSVYGRYRRDRHRHPFFVLENRITGECFISQLAWSGGYAFDFDLNDEPVGTAALAMKIRLDAPAPLRMLAAGEKYASPAVHFGAVFGGLDPAVQAMHDHIRASVLLPPTRGVSGWIEAGIGPEYDMDLDSTIQSIEHAASLGAEVFFVDAGWYVGPNEEDKWWPRCGDWRFDERRYPQGIGQVRDLAHQKGLLFGMWMDAERIGPESRCWQEHSDWLATDYNGRKNAAGLLNLADPQVAAWMEEQIVFLIENYQIDMFRLDYNVGFQSGIACNERDGFLENTFSRYYENVYALYRRLRARYPQVIFENCAGGGGRTDLGMLAGFTHSWVTDWQIHPNAFRITNGMTMALPPETVDRLIGGQAAYLTGDIRTQIRNLLFARPTIGCIKPAQAPANPWQVDIIRHHVEIYKQFVRPMQRESRIFHHTPELPGSPSGFGILELDHRDGSRGMLGVFRLAGPECPEVTVYLRGIDAARQFRVTFDNSGADCLMSGRQLSQEGLRIRLDGALTSELVLYEAIQPENK